jgi:hypothetical protein
VRVLIWAEELVKFRAAGIDTDIWPFKFYQRKDHPVKAQVRVEWQAPYGYRVIEVEAT